MSTIIPLKPLGKEDVRKLELALIFGTLFRKDVIEKIKDAHDRLTWLDSLVVAAGALARERAGYTVTRIADELGRSESTIRNHLQVKTEAGKLVKETYEAIVRNKGVFEITPTEELAELGLVQSGRIKELENRVKELEEYKQELEAKLKEYENHLMALNQKLSMVKEKLAKVLEEL
ncbi:MAG: transcriptional regulator [Desulfurococcales archaeon]|nr:transcriptional regulator [Desulfurococcales archaeon]